jgi:hypothetical protein
VCGPDAALLSKEVFAACRLRGLATMTMLRHALASTARNLRDIAFRRSLGAATSVMMSLVAVDTRLERALIIASMQAESLEVLESADVAPAQARAIVRAIEIEIAGAKDTLATKHDLVLLRQDLRDEMSELRTEMSELRTELKSDMAKLESKIHESASGITRQMYAAVLGQMAVLLGFAYFFATHVR